MPSVIGGWVSSGGVPKCGGPRYGRSGETGSAGAARSVGRRRLAEGRRNRAARPGARALASGRSMTRRRDQSEGTLFGHRRSGRRLGCRRRAAAAIRAGATGEGSLTKRELYDSCLVLVRGALAHGGAIAPMRPLALGWRLQRSGASWRELVALCVGAINVAAVSGRPAGVGLWAPSRLLRALLVECLPRNPVGRPAPAAARRRGHRTH